MTARYVLVWVTGWCRATDGFSADLAEVAVHRRRLTGTRPLGGRRQDGGECRTYPVRCAARDEQPAHPRPAGPDRARHPAIPPAEHDGVRDLIIIGSGPAGYTAATYAARANLHPLVFEGSQFGGALMTTTEVENFPGFPEGIQGPQLMDDMRTQAERFGAELVARDVTEVDLTANPKIVKVGGEVHLAHAVIVATGSKYRYLGLDNEQRLLGRGVSACATCDGFFFRDQDIVVVGGGDSAMEEATFLTRFAKSVTVVHRRPELRASKIMQKRAQDNEKIRWALGKQVTDVHGENTVDAVELTDVDTGAHRAAAGLRPVRRDRPRPAHRAVRRSAEAGRRGLHRGRPPDHPHQHRRRVRLRRRRRPHLPAGDHLGRHRCRRRDRRRALARRDLRRALSRA